MRYRSRRYEMKHLILSLLFIISIYPANAFGQCIKGDCDNGIGTYKYSNGGKYAGEWRDEKRHGRGFYTYPDGSKYVGEWKDDKRHRQGTYIQHDGIKYVGEWKDEKRHGKGTVIFPDGSKYIGKWKDDEFIEYLKSSKKHKPYTKKIASFTIKSPEVKTKTATQKRLEVKHKTVTQKRPEAKPKTVMHQQISKEKITPANQKTYPYTIQVSSFRDKEDSNSVAMELKKRGIPAFTCHVKIPGKGDWYRVFVGFYETFDEAQKAVLELKKQKYLHLFEVKLPYAVQVGIFDLNQELKKMEADLQSKAYLAYSIPDRPDKKKAKLMVGAFRTEKEAIELTKTLQKLGFNAKVVLR